jgi:hypothetical protein
LESPIWIGKIDEIAAKAMKYAGKVANCAAIMLNRCNRKRAHSSPVGALSQTPAKFADHHAAAGQPFGFLRLGLGDAAQGTDHAAGSKR